ncbi:tyrosyl-trna synthetase [Pseudomonas frederiksbergensis]|uniref:Tyrosyl-trna synthetase n=1 Tax=Pseudomonas frederiksbergensis TaxID=104087 RepID=A0A1J0EF61_9PSED|nr:DUF4174 domain-containing protein [Pseudomonas frederiksbergensis]APC14741.1 tyrosyl-trna synthetase [Pseudomonas frederiksbergensis]
MLIRSLTLATLLAVAGPLFAADNDTPLAQELGRNRPLIVIAPSSIDPTLVSLKKSLAEPANSQAFKEHSMVLYTVVNLMGQRDGKDLDAQTTMALIRELKLGVSGETKVILVGKDGEKKLDHLGPIEAKDIFATIDQLPAAEKEAVPPAPPPVEATPTKGKKGGKAGKAEKPAAPPQPLDD